MVFSICLRATNVRQILATRSLLSRNCRWQSSAAAQATPHEAVVSATPAESTELKEPMKFSSMKDKLSPSTLEAITVRPYKFKTMTPVQEEVLNLLPELSDRYNASKENPSTRDLLVRAKTGTGKTLAFLVPAIEARVKELDAAAEQAMIDTGIRDGKTRSEARRKYAKENVGTLIISPTRELATQIVTETLQLTQQQRHFNAHLLIGAVSKTRQLRDWERRSPDIVVGTPGRLRDILESEPHVAQMFSRTKILILDEADTLLDMGFRAEIDAIRKFLPPTPERQTFLFSATVSSEVRDIARTFLAKDHRYINTITKEDSPVHAHIPQHSTILPGPADQIPHVLRLLIQDQLANPNHSKTIVFLPTTRMTQFFAETIRRLSSFVLPAGPFTQIYEIHSKRSQDTRTNTSNKFRKEKNRPSILITSDVSARGVDYPGVTRVIQVGIPGSTEQYIHRVGRTGRAGTPGRGDLVLLPWETGFLTWQLTGVPLKSISAKDISQEVDALAAGPAAKENPNFSDVTTKIDNLEKTVKQFLPKLDPELLNETFLSLLGYYTGNYQELRVSKDAIVDGLKKWATDAAGLPEPPYISPGLIQRMGLGFKERRSSRGSRDDSGPRRSHSANRTHSWSGRGRQATRDDTWRGGSSSTRSGDRPAGSWDGESRSSQSADGRSSRYSGDRSSRYSDERSPRYSTDRRPARDSEQTGSWNAKPQRFRNEDDSFSKPSYRSRSDSSSYGDRERRPRRFEKRY